MSECANCNVSVYVPDGYKFEEGDLCMSCQQAEMKKFWELTAEYQCNHTGKLSVFEAIRNHIETAHRCCNENYAWAKRLEAEIEQWKTWSIVEIAVRNPNVASYMEHWEGRATKAEAENNNLRVLLAKGEGDCIYCGLPKKDMGKCAHGFPGCGRADDLMEDTDGPQSKSTV